MKSGTSSLLPKPRRRRRVLIWCLALALAALAWFWTPLSSLASTGSSYAAHVGCSCHFIEGRDLKQCRADLMPGMGPVTMNADDADKSVTARYLLLFPQIARYRTGAGCVMDKRGT
jgi:hypothetical protein